MPVPVYSNDLVTIAVGDLNFDAGTWDESGDAGWDTAGAMVDDENLQYTKNSINTGQAADSCTSAQYTKIGTGAGAAGPGTIMYQHTAAFTVPANGAILAHDLWAAPDALNVYAGSFGVAEAGVSFLIGDTFSVFDVHYVSGSDKPPAPEGGWATYCVDPTVTPDGSVGSPTTTTCVGIGIAATAQARGNPHAMQAIRYGRCEQIYTEGDVATPATFEGYAVIDNAPADRFNLLKYLGKGYVLRGLQTFGTAATAVYFVASDKTITIADDPKVGSSFNGGVVNNASSVLKWTNISIANVSAVAKYSFSNPDNAITEMTGGVLEDLGPFSFGTNSINTGVTYRGQELVTQLGATFSGCTFDKAVGAVSLLVDNIDIVTGGSFISDGSNHAVQINSIGGGSVTWDNELTGYDVGSTGSPVTTTATGNEAIFVNVASGTLDINVAAGATIPSVRSAGAIVNVIAGLVTLSISTQTGNEVRIKQGSYTIQHNQNVVGGVETYSYTYAADTRVTISVGNSGFIRRSELITLPSSDSLSSFTLEPDPSYIS